MSPLAPPGDLGGFPTYMLEPSQQLARVHRRRFGAWWFNSDGRMRFDLEPPRGTCYLAEEPLGAFVEVFRDPRVIPAAEVQARALAGLSVLERSKLADCTDARSRAFGITLEIDAVPDYAMTQRWARAFADSRYDGIRYRLRHDPAGALVGVALFGDAGGAELPATSVPIPEELIEEAWRRFRVQVVPGLR
jgi:RES domain-containing protein